MRRKKQADAQRPQGIRYRDLRAFVVAAVLSLAIARRIVKSQLGHGIRPGGSAPTIRSDVDRVDSL